MKTEKLNDWLQLAAAAGVLAGLLLVAYELRQQHELARAEMGPETFAAQQELLNSLRDVETARVYVKAFESPESLTLEEQVILDALYAETVTVTLARHNYMLARGVFEGGMTMPASVAGRILFSSNYGRQWWLARRAGFVPQVRDALDAIAVEDVESWFINHAALVKEGAIHNMEQQR